MTPIARAAVSPRYRRIIAVLGSQMGKTEATLNIIGARLDDDPTPTLYVGPTQKQVESMSSDRVIKMLRSVPSLWDKLEKGKRNKIGEKFIGGVRFGFAWAGSATELASHPAGLVLVDERDRMDDDTGGEGDPVELAEARIATFPDGKLIVVSTPTKGTVGTEIHPETRLEHFAVSDAVESPIWKLWQEGSRFEWSWPCQDCGEYFVPRFKHLRWPEGCTPRRALVEARLVCPHCGSLIEDRSKAAMNARGRYVAPGQRVEPDGTVVGPTPETDTASFWVSGLCSPWRTFGQRASAFLTAAASGDQTRVQTVLNTGLGELYAERGDSPSWERVLEQRAAYESGEVPDGVLALVAGVDVQKDRLVYVVRGFGREMFSALIECGQFYGDTDQPEVWQKLGGLLAERWGDDLALRMMLVDSGYRADQVYQFARRYPQVRATKGHDQQAAPVKSSLIDVTIRGQVIKNGLQLWHVDASYFKAWVHSRIEWPLTEPGAWLLPQDVSDDYCRQIVAESRIKVASGKTIWKQTAKDNHYLDAEVLAVAAAHILQVHRLSPPAPVAVPVPTGRRVRAAGIN